MMSKQVKIPMLLELSGKLAFLNESVGFPGSP